MIRTIKYILFLITIIIASGCNFSSKIIDNIGDIHLANKDYNKAITYYKTAIKIDSLNTDAIHSLGRAHENLNEYSTAINFYSRVIEIDSLNTLALRSLGYANYKLSKFKLAEYYYLESILIDSVNSTAYSNLGAIYEELEQYSQARKYHYKCLELNPTQYGVMTALANIELDFGNLDSAINLSYKSIGHLTKGMDAPHSTLGETYTKLGFIDSAIFHLNKAINYNPNSGLYFYKRGNSFFKNNMFSEALYDYNKAIELDSDQPPYYFNRGKARFALSQYQEALKDFNKVISYSDKYEGATTGGIFTRYDYNVSYYYRAKVKKKLGDFEGYIGDSLTAFYSGYLKNADDFVIEEIIDQPATANK